MDAETSVAGWRGVNLGLVFRVLATVVCHLRPCMRLSRPLISTTSRQDRVIYGGATATERRRNKMTTEQVHPAAR